MSTTVPYATTQISIMTGLATSANDIASVTNTNPATASGLTGLQTGDVVQLSGQGINSIAKYMVQVTGDTTTFIGFDATRYPTNLTGVQYTKLVMSPFCDATSIDGTVSKKDFKDITRNCDEAAQEQGTAKPGDLKMNIIWNGDDDLQRYLELMSTKPDVLYIMFRPSSMTTIRGFWVEVDGFTFNGKSNDNYSGSVSFKLRSFPQILSLTNP